MSGTFLLCGDSSRRVLSLILVSLSKLNGSQETTELWSSKRRRAVIGFVSYEVFIMMEGREMNFGNDLALRLTVPLIRDSREPLGKKSEFKVVLNYHYRDEGRPVYLRRDVYLLSVKAVQRGVLLNIRRIRGIGRVPPEDLARKIYDIARGSSLSEEPITLRSSALGTC